MSKPATNQKNLQMWKPEISNVFDPTADAVILSGDSAVTLTSVSTGAVKLIVTSPPYNLGKAYEKATHLSEYLDNLTPIVDQLIRVLADDGSLCWQVGNFVENSEIFPLDIFYAIIPLTKNHNHITF